MGASPGETDTRKIEEPTRMRDMRIGRWVLAALLLAVAAGASAQDDLFRDGFEPFLPECLTGDLGGDDLPLPSLRDAELLGCFEINGGGGGGVRLGEVAVGSLPIPRAANLSEADFDRLLVVGPEGRRRPAEFVTRSRWGRPLADASAPVRWLEAALAVRLGGSQSSATFALMRTPQPLPPADDPAALVASALGPARMLIDTGVAEFDIDGSQPQPIRRIRLRTGVGGALTEIFSAQAGSADEGLAVRVRQPGGSLLIDASGALPGSVVVDRVRWDAATGPVRAAVHIDGHLATAGTGHLCEGDPNWQRFPYSLTLRFLRGSADIEVDMQLGNACGIPQSGPEDALVAFESVEFRLPLARGVGAQSTALAATSIAMPQLFPVGSTHRYGVSQRRGGGTPWQRRAELVDDGTVLRSAMFFERPSIGLIRPLGTTARVVAIATVPWLRYREPQALSMQEGRLSFAFVAEPVLVGKAKSLWFAGRLAIVPVADQFAALNQMTTIRASNSASAERPLVLRPLPAFLDAAQVQPPLSGTLDGDPGRAYADYLQLKHAATVGDRSCIDAAAGNGNQWTCAKTFGLQTWPDIQFDERFGFAENVDPAANDVKLNYWDPALIELTEFQRNGDPRWLWDFAIPQSRLMAYTAYYNHGPVPNGPAATSNIAGHSFGSGGTGDGLWHRSASGSADYTYNRHQAVSYVLRPSTAQRDRFEAAGRAAALRFVDSPFDDTTWSAIGRLNLQYVESLANCAQFVEAQAGVNCDLRLRQVLSRLIQSSLSAGLMCELKFQPGPDCFMGQNFMLYAWFYPILDRLYLNYAHTLPAVEEAALRNALAQSPARFLASLPRAPDGRIDVDAPWPNGVACTLGGAGFTQVLACTPVPDPDNLRQNKLAMMSLLVRGAHYLGAGAMCPAIRQIGRDLFPLGTTTLGVLQDVAGGGWWKGAVESGQELSTAVLGYGRCPAVSPPDAP